MIRKLPHWINKTQHPKSVHMRELLRDYVLIMANTGMRHGTEAQNLKWQHITQFEDNGQRDLRLSFFYLSSKLRTLWPEAAYSIVFSNRPRPLISSDI